MLPEICGSISRQLGKDRAKEIRFEIEKMIKKGILKLENITSEILDIGSTLAIDLGIKGADSLFVTLAKEYNIPLLTFDEGVKQKIKGKIKIFEI